jgi:hypothetical protein
MHTDQPPYRPAQKGNQKQISFPNPPAVVLGQPLVPTKENEGKSINRNKVE